MKAVLEKAKENNELVSVYSDPTHPSRCSVGYVDCVDDNFVRLRAIARNGKHDGYVVRNVPSIFKVDIGGEYEKKIVMLKNFKFKDINLGACTSNILLETLKDAKKNKGCITIFFGESDDSVVGIVKGANHQTVEIHNLKENGETDGIIFVKFEAINSVNVNSEDEQIIEFLSEKREPK
ncbi:MAG: hypothetical protein HYW48_00245 [Deltaproteobacteria bacterium]|nr:hypothetical protein [Deltaproteobacteria bacterium]